MIITIEDTRALANLGVLLVGAQVVAALPALNCKNQITRGHRVGRGRGRGEIISQYVCLYSARATAARKRALACARNQNLHLVLQRTRRVTATMAMAPLARTRNLLIPRQLANSPGGRLPVSRFPVPERAHEFDTAADLPELISATSSGPLGGPRSLSAQCELSGAGKGPHHHLHIASIERAGLVALIARRRRRRN